jgi:ferric-dicitrate binding protein FerR (iron transport regulator)
MENAFQHNALFARWIKGELSDTDRQAIERHPYFPVFRRLLGTAEPKNLSDSEIQALLNRIPETSFPKKRTRPNILWWWIGAAAVLALVLLSWTLIQTTPAASAISATSIGEQKTVTLPDGSTVRLNAVSSIEVLPGNWASERRVQLIGEAFFQVKKGLAPFVVETVPGTVKVLGTSFTIKYRGGAYQVACYTGLVQVTTNKGIKQALRAGQKATARNGFWTPLTAITDSWPAWMQGESRFADAPVYEVLAELERQYNISISGSGTEGRRFSGVFIHNDLPHALRMVCEPLGLQYELEGHQVLLRKKEQKEKSTQKYQPG